MKNYSNYHEISVNDKIAHDGKLIFEYGLDGFEGYDVTINGVSTKVLITSKYSNSGDGLSKNIIGKIEDIERGLLVEINGENWLVVTKPEDNKIYRKATIKLCNTSLSLTGEPTQVDTGEKDWRGDPIYEETPGQSTIVPCIVESKIYYNQTTEAINLPDGHLQVTIPYTEHKDIALNGVITVYNDNYKIVEVDRTQSLNKTGILVISAKRE